MNKGGIEMDWMYYLLISIVVIIPLFYIGFSAMVTNTLIHPKTYTLVESRKKEDELSFGLMDLYDSWTIVKSDLMTQNGYLIRIYDVVPEKPTNKFCVIAHGYTYTHHGSIKYAKMMQKLGYHVVMFDQRYHGASKGENSTLGGKEQFDLKDVISFVYQKYGKEIFLGTFGESMGSSTVLLEQRLDERVKFVGSDCGFSSLEVLVRYLIKRKFPIPLYPAIKLVDFFFYQKTKTRLSQVSPKDAVKDAKVPIFFAHGLADKYILPFHAEVLYDSTPTFKKIYLAPNDARHAEAARKNEEEYMVQLTNFMKEVEKIYHLEVKE